MLRSSNAALKRAEEQAASSVYGEASATYLGVGLKVLYFVIMSVVGGALGIYLLLTNPERLALLLCFSGILGFITALVAMRVSKLSFVFGSIYCVLEGMFLGVVSLFFNEMAPGVVITAMIATLAIVLSCAFLYISGLIKVGNKFIKFLLMASFAFIVTMVVISLFNAFGVIDFADNFGLSILIGFVSVLLASLFLISDFEYAYQIVSGNSPKELEWMVAFGIAYTVIWLYYEILRLAYLLFGRRN